MTTLETRHDYPEELVDRLDAIKIHKAMKALGWKWATGPEPDQVPSPKAICEWALRLLKMVVDKPGSVQSGGFTAWHDDSGHLGIEFNLAAESCVDEHEADS